MISTDALLDIIDGKFPVASAGNPTDGTISEALESRLFTDEAQS